MADLVILPDNPRAWTLWGLVATVAFLYASVGHGGATGYLAVLSLFGANPQQMASTALVLNVLVAGLAWMSYARAGHFSWRLTWPFLVGSIPAAFLGGMLPLQAQVYNAMLALALLFSAGRLLWRMPPATEAPQPPSHSVALGSGAGLGMLSGMLGIGGGVFLSPLMLLARWADVRTTSATAAMFIVVNALAGLAGRWLNHSLSLGNLAPLLLAGLLGGLLGSHLGARHFPSTTLRKLLSLVLAIAAVKLALQSLGS